MGAWGHGLLQNDTAQDGLVDLIETIREDIAGLGIRPAETTAARLGAAVGLLLHLSAWHAFDPKEEASPVLVRAIDRQRPALAALPRAAGQLLRAVADGRGPELVDRPGKLSQPVRRALFATPSDGFPMERVFGKREQSLFAHPAAGRYVQTVADRCAARADEDFADTDVVTDLSREGLGMGAFGALLVIGPCRLPVRRVERWRVAHRRAAEAAAREAEGEPAVDEGEADFDRRYNECLERAFRLLAKRFAGT